MNHLPDKLTIEDLYNKLTAMSGQWFDLSSRVEGLENRQSEILRVLKTTPGIAAGSLPLLGVNPNGSQESTPILPTSDGGKSTMEHMPMTRTPDRPTSSGSSGSQGEEETPGLTVPDLHGYELLAKVMDELCPLCKQPRGRHDKELWEAHGQSVEAPGEQPTIWNLQSHLERAHQLITEVMQKIGAGSFSDDLDLARAHINTVMVTEGNKPAPQPEAPAAEQWHWVNPPAISEPFKFICRCIDGEHNPQYYATPDYLNAQQRVLDVNPESHTDATRGGGDDPIPQRECEHDWATIDVPFFVIGPGSIQWCKSCGALNAGGHVRLPVLLPQPIDPRSEAR